MTSRTARIVPVCATIAAAGLVAGACMASDQPEPRRGNQRPANSSTAIELVTQSGPFHQQDHALSVAKALLIEECMDAAGLEYAIDERIAEPLPDNRGKSLRERRENGYGLFDPTPNGSDISSEYPDGLPPEEQDEYRETLLGLEADRRSIELPDDGQVSFPGSGCVAQSQDRLYGDLLTGARLTYVPQRINQRLSAQVDEHRNYRAAIGRWSSCMAERGHGYETPEDAVGELQARYQDEGASTELRRDEIEIAVNDGECARQERLIASSRSLMQGMFDDLPKRERAALGQLANVWSTAVERAEGVIQDRCARTDASLPTAACRDR